VSASPCRQIDERAARPVPGSGRDPEDDSVSSALGWAVVVLLAVVALVGGYYLMATDDGPPPRPVEFRAATPAPNVSCVCACMAGAQ